MSETKTFLKKLFGFSVGPFFNAFFGLITVPITTRMLAPEEFGRSSMFAIAQTFFGMIAYLGMDQAFVREYHAEPDKRKLLGNATAVPLGIAAIVSILVVSFRRQVSELLFASYEPAAIGVLILYIFGLVVFVFASLVVRLEERAGLYSFMQIWSRLSNFLALVLLLLLYERSFRSIIFSSAIGLVGQTAIALWATRRYWSLSLRLDRELIGRMLRFGLPLVPAALMQWLLDSLDKMALRAWAGFDALGIYTGAVRIVMMLAVMKSAFTTFWTPTAYRWYEEGAPNSRFDKVRNHLLLAMSAVFMAIVLGKDLIVLLLGPKYRSSANLVPFLAFYPVLYTLSETTTLGISFKRVTWLNLIVVGASIVASATLNALLVPHMGAGGAAIANASSFLVFFTLRTFLSRRLWYPFATALMFATIAALALLSVLAYLGVSLLWLGAVCILVIAIQWRTLVHAIMRTSTWLRRRISRA